MNRRGFMTSLAALSTGLPSLASAKDSSTSPKVVSKAPFSPDMLREMARDLASRPYKDRKMVPQPWIDLTYDEYKSIWFNTQKSVWEGTDAPLRLDLFHPGLYFPNPVAVHVVEDGVAAELAFDIGLFDKTDKFPDLPVDETMGYSGIRLRAELEQPEIFQEFAVFQGASYFRAIARHQSYGLSARGLALKTGDADGEEFPEFTKFWVDRPINGEDRYRVHALLDSPSVAGAYSFDVVPGDETIVNVDAVIFPRVDLEHVGIGPLTSMFFFDDTNRNRFDDFRPAVHDSDGLSVFNGNGEMIWRPLANPSALEVSSFVDDGLRGFGLEQRAREFSDFADLEAHYHKRPSLWIEPGENWGKGAVRLVEIPTDREIYDNIVAYWRPREPVPAGSEYAFTYKMTWCNQIAEQKPVARVLNTLMGKGFTDKKVVAIDFDDHTAIPDDLELLNAHVSSNRGTVSAGVLQRNPETGGPRLAFSFDPGTSRSVELRAQLMREGKSVSEVWLYRWTRL